MPQRKPATQIQNQDSRLSRNGSTTSRATNHAAMPPSANGTIGGSSGRSVGAGAVTRAAIVSLPAGDTGDPAASGSGCDARLGTVVSLAPAPSRKLRATVAVTALTGR